MRFVLALSLLLSFPQARAAQGQTPTVQALLRPGQHRAELLDMGPSPRLQELTDKVKAAAQADPTWFQQHAAMATPGDPIPYHQKLGVTRAEYDELLHLLTTAQMRPSDTVIVVIESTDKGFRLGTGTGIPSLRGLEIDTVANTVRAGVGLLASGDPILPTKDQQATGEWGGPRWTLETLNGASPTGTHASFAVGRHTASGRTIIYYDVTKADAGQVILRETRFLMLLP